MGWRYTQFRIKHELGMRSGLLKYKFPVNPVYRQYISLQQWKQQPSSFFFESSASLSFIKQPSAEIANRFHLYEAGKFMLFNNLEMELGKNYDWVTNPDTGYQYDTNKHWTAIADYAATAGDIKYVWEKSRFSFLYDIIRYDYHYNKDCASQVFAEILSWINANPINCGPNYRCSQEISLRILNWTFALHYYKNSAVLTEEVFNKIQFAIYWQMDHVYKHINFSRIAVRNNHAITETLALYFTGTLYSGFPNAAKWKANGKAWFQEEIAYQVYEDGTFLQFSMNYHRVVIQLLTWAIVLSEKNGDPLNTVVYERAKKSVHFLRVCMNDTDGRLPNYGANDGALFFKLTDTAFRDYRPQLQTLASALKIDCGIAQSYEDALWYGLEQTNLEVCKPAKGMCSPTSVGDPINQNQTAPVGSPTERNQKKQFQPSLVGVPTDRNQKQFEMYSTNLQSGKPADGMYSFSVGGYYIIREAATLTFIRCGNHKDRPSQADNLHLDIWHNGENILIDAGSYKYNTDEETLNYFMGTASHNTVMLDDADQMKKGSRFIWYNWSQCTSVSFTETSTAWYFKGTIAAFEQVAAGILHTREVVKQKGSTYWIVKDSISGKPTATVLKQLWHLPKGNNQVVWNSADENNEPVNALASTSYVSELYGSKNPCDVVSFKTTTNQIETTLLIN